MSFDDDNQNSIRLLLKHLFFFDCVRVCFFNKKSWDLSLEMFKESSAKKMKPPTSYTLYCSGWKTNRKNSLIYSSGTGENFLGSQFPSHLFVMSTIGCEREREFQVAFIRNKKRKKRNVKTNDGRMALVKLFYFCIKQLNSFLVKKNRWRLSVWCVALG